jgi:Uncharacterized conserved protein (COG2071)
VRFRFEARHLLLVSWEVDEAVLTADLPTAVRPALSSSGRGLVSLAALAVATPRAGSLPGPGFSQIAVRTYVVRDGEHALFIYSLRSGLPGLAAVAYGVPVRPARVHVREGRVAASGLGVDLRYRHEGAATSVPVLEGAEIGSQSAVYLMSAGVRRLHASHAPFRWEAAELLSVPSVDPVLALGFDLDDPVSILYAKQTGFEVELPPVEVA